MSASCRKARSRSAPMHRCQASPIRQSRSVVAAVCAVSTFATVCRDTSTRSRQLHQSLPPPPLLRGIGGQDNAPRMQIRARRTQGGGSRLVHIPGYAPAPANLAAKFSSPPFFPPPCARRGKTFRLCKESFAAIPPRAIRPPCPPPHFPICDWKNPPGRIIPC